MTADESAASATRYMEYGVSARKRARNARDATATTVERLCPAAPSLQLDRPLRPWPDGFEHVRRNKQPASRSPPTATAVELALQRLDGGECRERWVTELRRELLSGLGEGGTAILVEAELHHVVRTVLLHRDAGSSELANRRLGTPSAAAPQRCGPTRRPLVDSVAISPRSLAITLARDRSSAAVLLRRLELQAGAPRRRGGCGVWSTNEAMRHAERELALQAQRACDARSTTARRARWVRARHRAAHGMARQASKSRGRPQALSLRFDSSSPAPTPSRSSHSNST